MYMFTLEQVLVTEVEAHPERPGQTIARLSSRVSIGNLNFLILQHLEHKYFYLDMEINIFTIFGVIYYICTLNNNNSHLVIRFNISSITCSLDIWLLTLTMTTCSSLSPIS